MVKTWTGCCIPTIRNLDFIWIINAYTENIATCEEVMDIATYFYFLSLVSGGFLRMDSGHCRCTPKFQQ